ncbi:MAG: hypothetical protein KQH63_02605 [Desulfobulbaceae bacterium]|nr:hypothetical protein [Desulfobulbaceae bacterium]
MKKKYSSSLLVSVVTAAALFVSSQAFAIPQGGVTLKDAAGNAVTGDSGTPYSPKMTCGGCHFDCATGNPATDQSQFCQDDASQWDCSASDCPDYGTGRAMSVHTQGVIESDGNVYWQAHEVTSFAHGVSASRHTNHGRNEDYGPNMREARHDGFFTNSPGMFGKYCPPSNRQLAAKDIDPLGDSIDPESIEAGAQDWVLKCGVCHVGGGQLEYDRDLNPYSAASSSGDYYMFDYPTPSNPNPAAVTPGFMSDTNMAEVDCLFCHSENAANGHYWYMTLGCSDTMPVGPGNDKNCDGINDSPMYAGMSPVNPPAVGSGYDAYNRNAALRVQNLDFAASMGIGARGIDSDMDGNFDAIDWGGDSSPITISSIKGTPNSANCSVCHARDDNTIGLPGMTQMKTGYGNYGEINPVGTGYDSSDSGDKANDIYWFDLGCKTGMGKRGHRIGLGPNDRWGMSMFNIMFGLGKNPGDPVVDETFDLSAMGMGNLQVKERMPDFDVHDIGYNNGAMDGNKLQCADCHYALGSTATDSGQKDMPAGTFRNVDYAAETIYGMDHMFAQGDCAPDNNSKDNLDGTVTCESCHITRTHPKLTDNGGSLTAPTPLHNGLPQLHIDRIGCTTCHAPEVYGAPGRKKYRDWSVGFYKNNYFRNMLDWNYDLITGSHTTMPVVHKWMKRNGETKIYPFLPSFEPIWMETLIDTGSILGGDVSATCSAGGSIGDPCAVDADCDTSVGAGDGICTTYDPEAVHHQVLGPVKNRMASRAGEVAETVGWMKVRRNDGNTVPLFDGFSLSDSLEIDTKAEIDEMIDNIFPGLSGESADVVELKFMQKDFDINHGIVPAEWALGGSKRGGCVSCHSSADPQIDTDPASSTYGQPTNPNYSPYSIGFFEGRVQPLDNIGNGMGIGGTDHIKNWFALFADFDCTALCGRGNLNDAALFNGMTNDPLWGTSCAPGSMFGTIDECVDMMTSTFDATMGFPNGTAMMMGMWDGVAGLQGFTVRETVEGLTQGCNPFAGPVNSPVAQAFGVSVNSCVAPGVMDGTCSGPADSMWPTTCAGGFRDGKGCAADVDCQGTMTATLPADDPMGGVTMLYTRDEVRTNFKINLQQSIVNDKKRVDWTIKGEKNPSNPNHMIPWQQSNYCYDYSGGNPFKPDVKPCADGELIATVVNANQYLGYTPQTLELLMSPGVAQAQKTYMATAQLSALSSAEYDLVVELNASRSSCSVLIDGVSTPWGEGCSYGWDTTAGTLGVSLLGENPDFPADSTRVLQYSDEGTYTESVTVCLNDDPSTDADESAVCDTASVDANPVVVETAVAADFSASVSGNEATISATIDSSAYRAYIYWGDRSRTISNTPVADLAAGITHAYSRSGDYRIRIVVLDALHNRTDYTFVEDGDLEVTIN